MVDLRKRYDMAFPISYDCEYIFGKYLASVMTYNNGCIEIEINDKGIDYKNTFHLYSLAKALKQVRKDIRYLENIKD